MSDSDFVVIVEKLKAQKVRFGPRRIKFVVKSQIEKSDSDYEAYLTFKLCIREFYVSKQTSKVNNQKVRFGPRKMLN